MACTKTVGLSCMGRSEWYKKLGDVLGVQQDFRLAFLSGTGRVGSSVEEVDMCKMWMSTPVAQGAGLDEAEGSALLLVISRRLET